MSNVLAPRHDAMMRVFDAWDSQKLVLFLGAGVSVDCGIPDWNNLVLNLLLEREGCNHKERPLRRAALRCAIQRMLPYAPTTLSRLIKNPREEPRQTYLNRLRDALYRDCPPQSEKKSATLSAVADLIKTAYTNGRFAIRAVVTTNFDELLETALTDDKRNVPISVIYHRNDRPTADALPIYHIHGFMPRQPRDVPVDQEVVFTEDEYHAVTYTAFQWAVVELTHLMQTSSILFIGCSMDDPNVRRLLDATKRPDGAPSHFAFRKVTPLVPRDRLELERKISKALGRKKRTRQIAEMTARACEEAQHRDAEILRQLGVTLLPIESYEEIPLLLRMLGTPSTGRRKGDRAVAIAPRLFAQ